MQGLQGIHPLYPQEAVHDKYTLFLEISTCIYVPLQVKFSATLGVAHVLCSYIRTVCVAQLRLARLTALSQESIDRVPVRRGTVLRWAIGRDTAGLPFSDGTANLSNDVQLQNKEERQVREEAYVYQPVPPDQRTVPYIPVRHPSKRFHLRHLHTQWPTSVEIRCVATLVPRRMLGCVMARTQTYNTSPQTI